jgi:hypothetical protein
MQRMIVGSGLSWDAVVEPDASWNDLDLDKIRRFMDAVRRAGRRPIPEGTNEREFLEKLELLKDGQPTRAALLLFVTQPTRRFCSAYLKLGRFRSPILIVDDREVQGTLLEQVEGAMAWFRERLQTKFVITGKPQRDTIWEYPLEVVREAVVNAVCHRYYTSPESRRKAAKAARKPPESRQTRHHRIRRKPDEPFILKLIPSAENGPFIHKKPLNPSTPLAKTNLDWQPQEKQGAEKRAGGLKGKLGWLDWA